MTGEIERLVDIITNELECKDADLETIKMCVRVAYLASGKVLSVGDLTEVVRRVYLNLSTFNPFEGIV